MTAEYVATDQKKETIRTERIKKTELAEVAVPLSAGGEITLKVLEDVEEYVGKISPQNNFSVKERTNGFVIAVYRTKQICDVNGCHSTATTKFDGAWRCESHLNSYTARHFG